MGAGDGRRDAGACGDDPAGAGARGRDCGGCEAPGVRAGARDEASYSVGQLAELSGVSVRTLHFYEEKGLLEAPRLPNGYRSYGRREVDRLQQVLLYRELGVGLDEIRRILDDPAFDPAEALRRHLGELRRRRERIDRIIASVEDTLAGMEGGTPMGDEERFEAFKREAVEENERTYGREVRERWGDEAADASNERLMGMSQADFGRASELEARVRDEVLAGLSEGDRDASGPHAPRAARAHAEWLSCFWPEGQYTLQGHAQLAEMYLADERFQAYYDAWAPGAARYLVGAIRRMCAGGAGAGEQAR